MCSCATLATGHTTDVASCATSPPAAPWPPPACCGRMPPARRRPPFEAIQLGEERLPSAAARRRPRRPRAVGDGRRRRRGSSPGPSGAPTSRSARRAAPSRPIRKLVVHHTASPNNPSNPAGVVRDMYRYHVVDRGYADIGYNFVIDHRGNIYEGRWARNYAPGEVHDGEDADGLGVMAAHAEGVNAGSCGVVLIGDFTSRQPTDAAVNALVQLLAWKAARHRSTRGTPRPYTGLFGQVRTFPNIVGHRTRRLHRLPRQRAERQARRHPRLGEGARRELRAQPDRHVEGHPLQATSARSRPTRPPATTCAPAPTRPRRTTTTPAATTPAAGGRRPSASARCSACGCCRRAATSPPSARPRSSARRRSGATAAPSPSRPGRSSRTGRSTPPGNVLAFGGATALGSLSVDRRDEPGRRPGRQPGRHRLLDPDHGRRRVGLRVGRLARLGRPQQPRRRGAADARHAVGQGLLDPGRRRRHVRLRRRHLVRLGGQVGRHRRRRLLAHAERARATGS